MFRPKENYGMSNNDDYSPKGEMQSNKTLKKFLFYSFIAIFMFILGSYFYMYMSKVASTINLDDSDVPLVIPKADDCNSQYVENEIISIFKERDLYFKSIALKSIDSILVKNKEVISVDDDSQKYKCKATIEILSDNNGFKPLNFDNNNLFYNKVQIINNNLKIIKYTSYNLPIIYTSQIREGKNEVKIYDLNIGKFECNGVCLPVYKTPPRPEKVKIKSISNKKQNTLNDSVKKDNTIQKQEELIIPPTQIETPKVKKKRKLKLFGWFRKNKNK